MPNAGDVGRAPSLLDVQRTDDVGEAHAATGRRAEEGVAADHSALILKPSGLSADRVAEKAPPKEAV